MKDRNEFEIVKHNTMSNLEIFLVEMTERRMHGHDDLELGIVLHGSVTLFTEQEQYEVPQGGIYLINRHQVHSFLSRERNNQILAFQLYTEFYRRLNYKLGFLQFKSNIIRSGHLHRHLQDLLLTCAGYYFSSTPFCELKCSSLLLDALYLLLKAAPCTLTTEKEYDHAQNNANRINQIMEYISEHYREPISLNDIASVSNLSACHVSHIISKALGISFQEYLNIVRFEHALRLIQNTSLCMLDICMETGFSSTRYLNHNFQKNFGCTAMEYRKAAVKPEYRKNSLPIENKQNRYSFEQSAFQFRILFPEYVILCPAL